MKRKGLLPHVIAISSLLTLSLASVGFSAFINDNKYDTTDTVSVNSNSVTSKVTLSFSLSVLSYTNSYCQVDNVGSTSGSVSVENNKDAYNNIINFVKSCKYDSDLIKNTFHTSLLASYYSIDTGTILLYKGTDIYRLTVSEKIDISGTQLNKKYSGSYTLEKANPTYTEESVDTKLTVTSGAQITQDMIKEKILTSEYTYCGLFTSSGTAFDFS